MRMVDVGYNSTTEIKKYWEVGNNRYIFYIQ